VSHRRGSIWHSLRLPMLAAMFLLCPGEVWAHSPVQSAGDFINGLLHPVTTPAHALVVVALGLLAGRRAPLDLTTPMLFFMPLSALALALTCTGLVQAVPAPVLLGVALVAAVWLALDKTPPPAVLAGLFSTGAVALGLDSAVGNVPPGAAFKTLFANWLSLVVLVCDVAIYVSLARGAGWMNIALRVAGSWIIAIALMALAFALRG
jgi:hydrogenase/urease accessory protein HupE